MDYEQKYKEALGWMRDIYPTLKGAEKEDAEHYFPELAESDDERIRKRIIGHLESIKMGCVICSVDTSEEIAWLEKQKEQKPAEWSEEDETMFCNLIGFLEGSFWSSAWKWEEIL